MCGTTRRNGQTDAAALRLIMRSTCGPTQHGGPTAQGDPARINHSNNKTLCTAAKTPRSLNPPAYCPHQEYTVTLIHWCTITMTKSVRGRLGAKRGDVEGDVPLRSSLQLWVAVRSSIQLCVALRSSIQLGVALCSSIQLCVALGSFVWLCSSIKLCVALYSSV